MGPLNGIGVVEMAAIGPVPFCGQLLGDLGAEVVVVDRVEDEPSVRPPEVSGRSRRSIGVDVRSDEGREIVSRLAAISDVLIEGFRPGVMERLGLGPEVLFPLNPGLVYGRMTGWGQDGPMAQMAGHDINYISMVGALESIGPPERPVPPLNLVGDYGGGAMFLAVGVLAALVERAGSERGQVVDAAMVDGAASLMDPFYALSALGSHDGPRGTNFLDGGAPFYRTYRTADGRWMAVGALESRFYHELLIGLDLVDADLPDQWDTGRWTELATAIADKFASADRDAWTERFAGTDACVTPVLDRSEAPSSALAAARDMFVDADGLVAPAPAPRFSRTPAATRPVRPKGADTDEVLQRVGYDAGEVTRLRAAGLVR